MPTRAPTDTGDQAPVTNGHDNNRDVEKESILPICAALAKRVNAFLESEPETELLRRVQEQTRSALGVISTALDRYRYFHHLPSSCSVENCSGA
jgi:FAD synthetase